MSKMCQNCGAIINDDSANNCVNCGAVLPVNVANDNQQFQYQAQGQYQQPYQSPYQYQQPQQVVAQKSKIAAGIMGIILGVFGVHNFYLGYTGKAVAQLLISLLSCFILSPISAVWGLIEGIMILTGSINTDSKGMPLGE